jgi:hypothetical protein
MLLQSLSSVSDAKGNVWGGHLISGTIFTTLELVLGVIQNVEFSRAMDSNTGYNELVVNSSFEMPKNKS